MKMLVMSCSKAKVPQSEGHAPAYLLYDGPQWRVYRKWRREHPVQAVDRLHVCALSAEHGFIPATWDIAEYDRKMTADRVCELAVMHYQRHAVRRELHHAFGDKHEPDILLFGSELYSDLFESLLPEGVLFRRAGDEGRGIGDQLAELKEWLG